MSHVSSRCLWSKQCYLRLNPSASDWATIRQVNCKDPNRREHSRRFSSERHVWFTRFMFETWHRPDPWDLEDNADKMLRFTIIDIFRCRTITMRTSLKSPTLSNISLLFRTTLLATAAGGSPWKPSAGGHWSRRYVCFCPPFSVTFCSDTC